MERRDEFLLELYRQAWETSRHRYTMLLNLTSVLAVLVVAGVTFVAQTEQSSDRPLAALLIAFAFLSVTGALFSWQVKRMVGDSFEVRAKVEVEVEVQLLEPNSRWSRGYPFVFWTVFVAYVIATVVFAVVGILLWVGVNPFDDPIEGSVPVAKAIEPTQFTPTRISEPPWHETGCLDVRPQAFCDSMKDAEFAEPSEISTELTAITAQNNSLIWSDVPGRSRVLSVTWTNWDGYDSSVGDEFTTTREIWVTIVPQARDFCQNYRGGESLSLRMEQLMGLAPDSGKTKFIELWAFPEDMFRPSPDPAITDHESELDFPESDSFVSVSAEHIDWINSLRGKSYEAGGLPWTRLGYTYDWGNPESDVGLSEFVIRANATVGVKSVTSNDDYC